MKRIKIMLTAITVFAVVGGALAFKAKKFTNTCYYSSTASHNGVGNNYCNYNAIQGRKLGAGGDTHPFATSHNLVDGACPTTITCTQRFTSAAE